MEVLKRFAFVKQFVKTNTNSEFHIRYKIVIKMCCVEAETRRKCFNQTKSQIHYSIFKEIFKET